ncbi:hypothetical protein V6Z12_A09G041300, partial [Gossypium hirsutum]
MKIICWNCGGVGNPATVHDLKQLLVAIDPDIIFLCETKINANRFDSVCRKCSMESCLAVNVEGKSGGLVMMWKDSKKGLEDGMRLRLTGFYGQADPNNRNLSWDMLRRVKDTINEGWILAGDFNAILNNAEKEGGRRKPRSSMEDFCKLLEELALVDVKTNNGWFTWSNNSCHSSDLVKERFDRFLIYENFIGNLPFLTTKIVRQSKSDHEAILMDTLGSKPGDNNTNLRTWFRYDVCWNKEKEERDVITSIWSNNESNLLDKLALVRKKLGPWLGPWQYQRFRRMKYKIKGLEKEISKLMDGPMNEGSLSLLKCARSKLGRLYDVEEKYWAFRARSKWLKEGDRNTPFFHIRASGRRKKNSIERLKDAHG